MSLRPFQHDDVPGLVDLINACAVADGSGLRMSVERLETRIRFLGADVEHNLCMALAAEDGALAGYSMVHTRRGPAEDIILLAGGVLPDRRNRGIGTLLFQWALARAAALKLRDPTHVDLSQYGSPSGLSELATELGFSVARIFYMLLKPDLESPPPPSPPPGVTLRHFIPNQDEAALNQAVNAAFAENWAYTPTTDEAAARMYNSGYYEHENILIAEDAGGICGHCFVRFSLVGRNPDGGHHALIGSLGVIPRRRGQGMGRALLMAAIGRLRIVGAQSAILNVDAGDTSGALRLYESAGFRVLATDRAWRKTI